MGVIIRFGPFSVYHHTADACAHRRIHSCRSTRLHLCTYRTMLPTSGAFCGCKDLVTPRFACHVLSPSQPPDDHRSVGEVRGAGAWKEKCHVHTVAWGQGRMYECYTP